jgi:hypothetical protein
VIARSSIVDGAGTAIQSDGTGAVVQLYGSVVANNVSGWSTTQGGAVTSWGNNALSNFNGSGDGAPTPVTLK